MKLASYAGRVVLKTLFGIPHPAKRANRMSINRFRIGCCQSGNAGTIMVVNMTTPVIDIKLKLLLRFRYANRETENPARLDSPINK